ncbi:glutathione S-transferase [Rhodobacteraceae bacterium DSL-40]|uniref:glutathione S-transferase family protein n=1 Tax=Amaricoccus sp. B4 TaxID=3368557 RepID=UPI000DAD1F17
MKLYDLDLSGNCYKIRLFLSLIGQECEIVPVDFLGGAHRQPPLSAMNPFLEIPILVDGELILRDSQAILVYLARKYGGEGWLPTEPGALAQVMEWLMAAENEIARGPNDARLHVKFGVPLDHELALVRTARILDLLEARLARRDWLALGRPTIADIACFPYVALGHEGHAPVGARAHVTDWINRIKALPNFIGMPGL